MMRTYFVEVRLRTKRLCINILNRTKLSGFFFVEAANGICFGLYVHIIGDRN